MLRGFTLKFISLTILLSICSSFAQADSVLTQLPFGIKLGVTKNSEIKNRGVCVNQIQVSENYFRCQTYDMLGGKFSVSSSENEVVIKINFHESANSLPQNWKALGLTLSTGKFGDSNNSGTSQSDFLTVIESEGGENITTSIVLHSIDTGNSVQYTTVSFDLGSNHFDARFMTLVTNSNNQVEEDLGLDDISITEAY